MKILIDNGHGKETAGKRSPYSSYKVQPALDFFEWSWNREIARCIVSTLKHLGYDAELLVPEETDISLAERCKRANKYKDAILVSVHANAHGNGREWTNARGWSVYTSKGQTKADILATDIWNAAKRHLPESFTMRKDTTDGDVDYEESFYILKHTTCPAVLTENLFYTNVGDTEYLLSSEGKKAIIDAHIDGILAYLQNPK